MRIGFIERRPPTTWNVAAPGEHGFYAHVNPDVDHPRWSQFRERRIGEYFTRNSLPFNGYADQVASLYAGMNLRKPPPSLPSSPRSPLRPSCICSANLVFDQALSPPDIARTSRSTRGCW